DAEAHPEVLHAEVGDEGAEGDEVPVVELGPSRIGVERILRRARARVRDRRHRPFVRGVPQRERAIQVDPVALPQGETGGVEVERRRVVGGGVAVLATEARGREPARRGGRGDRPDREEEGQTLHGDRQFDRFARWEANLSGEEPKMTTRAIRLALLAAVLWGCPDPDERFEEFVERTEPFRRPPADLGSSSLEGLDGRFLLSAAVVELGGGVAQPLVFDVQVETNYQGRDRKSTRLN